MMGIGKAGIVLILSALLAGVACSSGDKDLTLTYLDNDGFLLASGGRQVLVDALFDTSFGAYAVPSAELVGKMTTGGPPFGRIDLFLVTHDHRDHFYAPLVADFLRHHPETRLAAPKSVCDLLRKEAPAPAGIEEFDLALGGSVEREIGGIKVRAYRTRHARDVDGTRAVNFAYLVELGSMKCLHIGDGPVEFNLPLYESFGLEKERIDLVFLSSFELSGPAVKFIRETVKPRYVVPMHIAVAEFDAEASKYLAAYPNAVLLGKPLESKVLKFE